MRFDGSWRLCDDRVVRPVFSAAVRAENGAWVPAVLLADVAADRTVLSEDLWRRSALPAFGPVSRGSRWEGVLGKCDNRDSFAA